MKTIDSSGLKCPMPLLFLRRGLISAKVGEQVCLISTDKKSLDDVPKFCEQMKHSLVEVTQKEDCWHFIVEKIEQLQ
jgi:tRNA 2-thiouridine synthesizing protein A